MLTTLATRQLDQDLESLTCTNAQTTFWTECKELLQLPVVDVPLIYCSE